MLLAPFTVALVASRVWPWPIPGESIVRPLGFVLVFAAIGLMFWATARMDSAGTTKVAWREGTTLVTDGPFAWSRNPAYLAFVGWIVGASLVVASWWPLAVLPPTLVAFHWLVVRREEASLAAQFGQEYAAYRTRVRRWF